MMDGMQGYVNNVIVTPPSPGGQQEKLIMSDFHV